MKGHYGLAVATEDPLVTLVHADVQRREHALKEAQRKHDLLKLAVSGVTEKRQLVFRVYLEDMWQDHGGKSVTIEHRGSLRVAMEKAIVEYVRANSRGPDQVNYKVSIVLPKVKDKDREVDFGLLQVPEEYWKDYKFKHGK